jgi:carboxylesterase type B
MGRVCGPDGRGSRSALAGGWPKDLKLDAWAPTRDTATKRAAIVWAFGGGFVGGEPAGHEQLRPGLRPAGLCRLDHRLSPAPAADTDINYGIIPAYLDTVAASSWLKANAARYGVDPDAIAVGASRPAP